MQRVTVAIIACIFVFTPGCGYVPRGDEIHVGFDGSFDVSESEFKMEGTLHTGGGAPEQDRFRDVTVKLYTKDGSLIYSENLGDWQVRQKRLNVSIETDKVPHYVVIESEDFWDEKVQVEYFVRKDSDYAIEYASSKSELPYK